jgi:hypothetical protein
MRFKRLAVLCLLAWAGCSKPRIEPERQLIKIGKLAKLMYSKTSSFVVGTAAQAPRKRTSAGTGDPSDRAGGAISLGGGGCCGSGGTISPNHCRADPVAFAGDPVWSSLDFQIDEDSLFYYDYTGTKTSFTARATGDLDCDGTEIVYTLLGTVVNGAPEVQLIEPTNLD